MSPSLALVGFLVGIIVGLTSTGGGAILTPALMFLGVPPAAAVGSDVLIASVMKLFGGGAYAIRRDVHWPTVWRLALGSVPGAVLGVVLLNQIPVELVDTYLRRGLGFVLLLAGVATLLRIFMANRALEGSLPSVPRTAFLGFLIGVMVAMTSVGSGSLLLCALVLFFPLRPTTLVGTDLVHALLLSSVATVGHLFSGRVDVAIALAVLIGGIPGVLLGARFAHAVPQRVLKAGLAVVLLVIGTHLALSPLRTPAAGPLASAQVHVMEVSR